MATLKVKISDNVLDDEDHSEFILTIENGKVIEQNKLHGLYNHEFTGMTVPQLSEWSFYDNTGFHPERYHQIFNYKDDCYQSNLSYPSLAVMLSVRAYQPNARVDYGMAD